MHKLDLRFVYTLKELYGKSVGIKYIAQDFFWEVYLVYMYYKVLMLVKWASLWNGHPARFKHKAPTPQKTLNHLT